MKATFLLAGLFFVALVARADGPSEVIPGLPPAPTPWPDWPPSHEEIARRFAATEHLHVPLPRHTPFDTHPAARRAYLRAYRTGYRRVMCGVVLGCYMLDSRTPHRDAIIAGDQAGQLAAEILPPKNTHPMGTSNPQ